MFQNTGPSPTRMCRHTMASDGKRVFVLRGKSLTIKKGDETALVHVLDTSTYFLLFILFAQPPRPKTQKGSSTRISTPMLSSLVRSPLNSRGIHPRVPQPGSNHNTRRSLHRMLTLHTVLLLCKKLPPKNWVAPPPGRLLTSET